MPKILNSIAPVRHILPLLLPAVLLLGACSPSARQGKTPTAVAPAPLTLTVLHVGDTHSYVAPHNLMLQFNGLDTIAEVGGWTTIGAAIDEVRLRDVNVLLLHSGDASEGTMWFTKFDGMADYDAMNALFFDALELGDHEFTQGTQEAARVANSLKFPVLAANLDVSAEPSLAHKVKPYAITVYEGQEVGVIGLITPDTQLISRPGNAIKFLPPSDTAKKYVAELTGQGINKIIVLSHLGYEADVALAREVPGIDVIIGGHSHMLMGGPDLFKIGLNPERPYPTDMTGPSGDKVLVAHAWENNQFLGQLTLDFDQVGKIIGYSARPLIATTANFELKDASGWNHLCPCQTHYGEIMQVIDGDPAIKVYWNSPPVDLALRLYSSRIESDLVAPVATANDDILRGAPGGGPGLISANAFLWSATRTDPAVQIAILDGYDVRADLYKGQIAADDISKMLPWQRNLVTATVKGGMLKTVLEDNVDFNLRMRTPAPHFYAAGLNMKIDEAAAYGQRVSGLQVRNADGSYAALKGDADYSIVTTDYLAARTINLMIGGVSWMKPLAEALKEKGLAENRYRDLGISEKDALISYLKMLKQIGNGVGDTGAPSEPGG